MRGFVASAVYIRLRVHLNSPGNRMSICGQNQPPSCGSESATFEVKRCAGCSGFWDTWSDVSTQSEPTPKHYSSARAGMVQAAHRAGTGTGPGHGGQVSGGDFKTSQPAHRLGGGWDFKTSH